MINTKWFIFEWNPIGYIKIYIKIRSESKDSAIDFLKLIMGINNKVDVIKMNGKKTNVIDMLHKDNFTIVNDYSEIDDCYHSLPREEIDFKFEEDKKMIDAEVVEKEDEKEGNNDDV